MIFLRNCPVGQEYDQGSKKCIPEKFHWFGIDFNVGEAEEIIRQKPRKAKYFSMSKLIGTDAKVSERFLKKLTSKDCDRPGIVIQVDLYGEGVEPFLIDGHHRFAKCETLGRRKFLAYELTPEESNKVW